MHDLTSSTGGNIVISNYPNTAFGGVPLAAATPASSSSSTSSSMSCKREAMKLDVISTTAGSCAPPPDKRPRTHLALHGLPSCATVGGNADAAEKDGALLTPTPTQFLFPKRGTEEQEDYVRGFSQALEAIYQRNGAGGASDPSVEDIVPVLRVIGPEGSTWTTVSTASYSSDTYGVNSNLNVVFPSTNTTSSSFSATSGLISLSNPMMTASHCTSVTSPMSSELDRYSFISPTYLSSQMTSENNSLHASSVFTTLQNCHPSRATSVPPAPTGNFFNMEMNVHGHGHPAIRDSGTPGIRPEPSTLPVNSSHFVQNFGDRFTHTDDSQDYYLNRGYTRTNLHTSSATMMKSEPDSDGEMRSIIQPPGGISMNPDDQERMKLERKRAKNRVAAQRCQQRKIEKITRLEDKVAALRDQNANLAQTVAALSEHISGLKHQIVAHADRGCRLMLPHIPT